MNNIRENNIKNHPEECKAFPGLSHSFRDGKSNIKDTNQKFKNYYNLGGYFLLFTFYFLLSSPFAYCEGFDDAWSYFLSEDYNIAERITDSYLNRGQVKPEYVYLKAMLLAKRQRFEDARSYFERLSNYGGRWAEHAEAGRGDTYFLAGDFKAADTIYSNFLKTYSRSDMAPDVIYRYALCLKKQGFWPEAKKALADLTARYPKSISASYARRILDEDEFYFTIQVGSFLNYDNAHALSAEVSAKGFESYVKKVVHQGRLYYRVRVGQLSSRTEVDAQFRKLAALGYSGIIYP